MTAARRKLDKHSHPLCAIDGRYDRRMTLPGEVSFGARQYRAIWTTGTFYSASRYRRLGVRLPSRALCQKTQPFTTARLSAPRPRSCRASPPAARQLSSSVLSDRGLSCVQSRRRHWRHPQGRQHNRTIFQQLLAGCGPTTRFRSLLNVRGARKRRRVCTSPKNVNLLAGPSPLSLRQ